MVNHQCFGNSGAFLNCSLINSLCSSFSSFSSKLSELYNTKMLNGRQQLFYALHFSNSWKSSLNSVSSAAFEDLLWVAQQKRIWTFWKFRTRNEPLLKLSLQNKSLILSTLIFNTFLNCGSLSPFFMEYLCRNPLRICVQILFKFVWSHQSYRQSNCQLSTSE